MLVDLMRYGIGDKSGGIGFEEEFAELVGIAIVISFKLKEMEAEFTVLNICLSIFGCLKHKVEIGSK